MDMNLQQLRYLVAAADAGSLSGAARTHRVSQPVVSRALHDLEREFTVVLFRRHGRRLVPTEAGQSVVASARRAVQAIDDVERTARQASLGSELVIVATPTNSALLSPIVTSFVKHHPQTALRLRRAGSIDEVFEMVDAGEAELGFGDLPDHSDSPSRLLEPIWQVDVVLVSPLDTRLPPVVSLAHLTNAPLILPPEGSERRQGIENIIALAGGRPPRPALATEERSAWITSAQRGIGSFLSYQPVAAELDGVEFRTLDPPIRATTGFVYQARSLSNQGREMLRLANECPLPTGCHPLEQPPVPTDR
jgi:DNA-binding transcriptional LysR family regulator